MPASNKKGHRKVTDSSAFIHRALAIRVLECRGKASIARAYRLLGSELTFTDPALPLSRSRIRRDVNGRKFKLSTFGSETGGETGSRAAPSVIVNLLFGAAEDGLMRINQDPLGATVRDEMEMRLRSCSHHNSEPLQLSARLARIKWDGRGEDIIHAGLH